MSLRPSPGRDSDTMRRPLSRDRAGRRRTRSRRRRPLPDASRRPRRPPADPRPRPPGTRSPTPRAAAPAVVSGTAARTRPPPRTRRRHLVPATPGTNRTDVRRRPRRASARCRTGRMGPSPTITSTASGHALRIRGQACSRVSESLAGHQASAERTTGRSSTRQRRLHGAPSTCGVKRATSTSGDSRTILAAAGADSAGLMCSRQYSLT